MNISLYTNISNPNYFYKKSGILNQNFTGKKPEKLIQKLNATKSNKKVQFTFEEMKKIYEHLGYDITLKRGAHAIINISQDVKLPLVIPHKDKYVSPFDIKRLRLIIDGNIDQALKV